MPQGEWTILARDRIGQKIGQDVPYTKILKGLFCTLTIFVNMRRQLSFEDFITCFRKQFVFQTGRFGRRACRYYTNNNQEQGLKSDQWAIMAFIQIGSFYGFTDFQMRKELQIKSILYSQLKDEAAKAVSLEYPDQLLRQKIMTKIGLVKNCIRWSI